MNKLKNLIEPFIDIDNWKEFVRLNFDRKSGTYSFLTVSRISVKYDGKIFYYPTKLIFEYGYVKSTKKIKKVEQIEYNEKKVIITEIKQVIHLGLYKREIKYSGDIYEIISDIIGPRRILKGRFSNDLLTINDNPLYSLDSNSKWPSYVLVLDRKNSRQQKSENNETNLSLDILNEYGIHYDYDYSLKEKFIIIFPLPYVKIVENKIKREQEKESIFLVLEYNQLGIFYTPGVKIELESLIKDLKQDIIYEKTEPIIFSKAKYQVIEILPDKIGQISFASFTIKLNGKIVDKTVGYYAREIKLDVKIK